MIEVLKVRCRLIGYLKDLLSGTWDQPRNLAFPAWDKRNMSMGSAETVCQRDAQWRGSHWETNRGYFDCVERVFIEGKLSVSALIDMALKNGKSW
jgi:hypothetical protein